MSLQTDPQNAAFSQIKTNPLVCPNIVPGLGGEGVTNFILDWNPNTFASKDPMKRFGTLPYYGMKKERKKFNLPKIVAYLNLLRCDHAFLCFHSKDITWTTFASHN
jgi:hypothetical protein